MSNILAFIFFQRKDDFLVFVVLFLFFLDSFVKLLLSFNQFTYPHFVETGISIIHFRFFVFTLKMIDPPPAAAAVIVLQHVLKTFLVAICVIQAAQFVVLII